MKLGALTSIGLSVTLTAAAAGRGSSRPFDQASATTAESCASLTTLTLPNSRITAAESVGIHGFSRATPGGRMAGQPFRNSTAMCRVAVTVAPSPDSDIKIEVWLPTTGWNGKFQAVGNGSWGGTINYPAMDEALKNGYATSSTDMGHAGESAAFALGHPEKLSDYAFRSQHEMALKAKNIIEAFYRKPPERSYFEGCSTGGRQALMAASRFPGDFDGIIAGAAANPKTHLDAWRISMAQAMFTEPVTAIPASKFPMIHQAVLDSCDAEDGLKDGLIQDPTRCRFDPRSIQCTGTDEASCLTPPQVAVARTLLNPLRDSSTGRDVFPGLAPGSELGWAEGLASVGPWLENAWDQFRYVVFQDPKWHWTAFELQRDLPLAVKAADGALTAIDPDLSEFARRGGKLLMYHGWSDPAIPPGASVTFHERAAHATKAPATNTSWLRLFMVPGMGHCRGGEGPNTFDMVTPLDAWVGTGVAPERIVATHSSGGTIDRTRPLCAYPQVARYGGTGSINDAANFTCRTP